MLERLTLARDLMDCRGAVLAPAGTRISIAGLREVAARTDAKEVKELPDAAWPCGANTGAVRAFVVAMFGGNSGLPRVLGQQLD